MGKRQKAWARHARANLIRELGGVCAACGAVDLLEFDCIKPAGRGHHRFSYDKRTSFYRRQHIVHRNIQLLCSACHERKTARDLGLEPSNGFPPVRGNTPPCPLNSIGDVPF